MDISYNGMIFSILNATNVVNDYWCKGTKPAQ